MEVKKVFLIIRELIIRPVLLSILFSIFVVAVSPLFAALFGFGSWPFEYQLGYVLTVAVVSFISLYIVFFVLCIDCYDKGYYGKGELT